MNNNSKNISPRTISLFSQPYLDNYNECYKNIITLNALPQGSLANFVRQINPPQLSHFKNYLSPCDPIKKCCLALSRGCVCTTGCDDLMVVDDIPDLISYLLENGYTVNTSITKMFNQSEIRFNTNNANKLICFITYTG
jgi:hypothetical protein